MNKADKLALRERNDRILAERGLRRDKHTTYSIPDPRPNRHPKASDQRPRTATT